MKHTKQNHSWLKIRILFLRMIWRVLTNKEQGWIFFKMSEEQQESFLYNDKTIIVNIRYMGVDSRVIEKILDRMETKPISMIVGEDMICPMTKKHCDDECCPVGATCNMAHSDDQIRPDNEI